MALRDDWWYAELNNIYHKWQKFITSCYIVGGRVAIAGTPTVIPDDGLAAARDGRNI